jgi:hypothetical protein
MRVVLASLTLLTLATTVEAQPAVMAQPQQPTPAQIGRQLNRVIDSLVDAVENQQKQIEALTKENAELKEKGKGDAKQ